MNWKNTDNPATVVPCGLQQRSQLSSDFLRNGSGKRPGVIGGAKPPSVVQGAHLLTIPDA